jgi:hypothetical protein
MLSTDQQVRAWPKADIGVVDHPAADLSKRLLRDG